MIIACISENLKNLYKCPKFAKRNREFVEISRVISHVGYKSVVSKGLIYHMSKC